MKLVKQGGKKILLYIKRKFIQGGKNIEKKNAKTETKEATTLGLKATRQTNIYCK